MVGLLRLRQRVLGAGLPVAGRYGPSGRGAAAGSGAAHLVRRGRPRLRAGEAGVRRLRLRPAAPGRHQGAALDAPGLRLGLRIPAHGLRDGRLGAGDPEAPGGGAALTIRLVAPVAVDASFLGGRDPGIGRNGRLPALEPVGVDRFRRARGPC